MLGTNPRIKIKEMKRTFEEILESYHVQLGDNRRDESIAIAAEEYANQSKWISVKERLPNKNLEVLCYSESLGVISDRLTHILETGDAWFYGDREEYCTDVTYWQPLPNPPTK